jgi:hypothetical protein
MHTQNHIAYGESGDGSRPLPGTGIQLSFDTIFRASTSTKSRMNSCRRPQAGWPGMVSLVLHSSVGLSVAVTHEVKLSLCVLLCNDLAESVA